MAPRKPKQISLAAKAGEIIFFQDEEELKLQIIDKKKYGIVVVFPKTEIPALIAFLKEVK
jgi:hypothetical protein